jgi:hypothetical protein
MRTAAAAFVLLFSACAPGSGRVRIQSQSPSFHAGTIAIAATRGASAKSVPLAHDLARRLLLAGMRAVPLEEADSVLAGSALTLEGAADPSVLAEIRQTTGAEAVAFLTLAPGWRALEIAVLSTDTGDAVLRATARPRGDAFATPEDAAAAAAEALAALAPDRARGAAAVLENSGDDIPVP